MPGKFKKHSIMSIVPERKILIYNLAIAAIASLLFIPFLGEVHLFDWDEINFAESAREMIASGDYLTVQINFIPFWEKPPLFIWMQVLSMKIFGINEFAARFPNAICGVVSLLVLFNTGRKLTDIRFGLLWVMLYAGAMLPFLFFKSGIIDPWFNLFIFIGIYQFYLYFENSEHKMLRAALSAMFIGLAILTKGPVALLVFLICFVVFLLVKKFMVKIRLQDVLIFSIVLVITGGLWFILQILQGNFTIIADFIVYQIRLFKTQDAGHGGFLLYHFVVLLIGVFPASMIALPAFFPSKYAKIEKTGFYLWMLILFWVVLILFTIVRTKIVHYSSLCYFPLTFMAAWSIYHYSESYKKRTEKIVRWLIMVTGLILALLLIVITCTETFKDFIIRNNWINDPFAVANLAADGNWKGYEFVAGAMLVIALVFFALQKNLKKAIWILTGIIPFFMFLSLALIVPKVESYSQRAAIEFFESVSDEDVYLSTLGYKSYAHLFYGKIRNQTNEKSREKEWLLRGNIDKTAYFSTKINHKQKIISENPSLIYLYEKNGFVFFKRNVE